MAKTETGGVDDRRSLEASIEAGNVSVTAVARAHASWPVVAAVAAVAALAAVAATLAVQRVTTPGDRSAEAGFTRDMSTHHAQAVSMAMTAYRSVTDPKVRQLAVDIALTQQSQIGTMQGWLESWGLLPTGQEPAMAWMARAGHTNHLAGSAGVPRGALVGTVEMPGMATPEEMGKLRQARGEAADVLFCQLMFRHHQGAFVMVDAVLVLARDRRVLELARAMKAGQQHELDVLQDLLSDHHAAPLPR